jgi:hypothetical protein
MVHVPLVSEAWLHGTRGTEVAGGTTFAVVESQQKTVWAGWGFLDAVSAVTPHAHPQVVSVGWINVVAILATPQHPPLLTGSDPLPPVQLPVLPVSQIKPGCDVVIGQPEIEAPSLQDEINLLESEQQQQQPAMAAAPNPVPEVPQLETENSSHAKFVGDAVAAAEGTLIE